MKIFNSPLVFRIPITIFQLSTSIIFFHTTTTFFQNSVCTKVQNKNPLVSIWIFQNGKKKKKRNLSNEAYQTFLKGLPANKKQALKMT